MDETTRELLAKAEFTTWAGQGERYGPEWADHLVPIVEHLIREAKREAWDERNDASPQYLGPLNGHYDDCMGWEDCYCDSYPNPYRDPNI